MNPSYIGSRGGKMTMRKISGIGSAILATLFASLLFSYLPSASRVGDLTRRGAGLELGEWQISVGIFLTAVVLFAVLAVWSFRIRFALSLTIVSWCALGSMAGAVWFLYSLRSKTGVLNQQGRGLSYDEWWASAIPWTIALVLVGLCAGASLAHWAVERRRRSRRDAQRTGEVPPASTH